MRSRNIQCQHLLFSNLYPYRDRERTSNNSGSLLNDDEREIAGNSNRDNLLSGDSGALGGHKMSYLVDAPWKKVRTYHRRHEICTSTYMCMTHRQTN